MAVGSSVACTRCHSPWASTSSRPLRMAAIANRWVPHSPIGWLSRRGRWGSLVDQLAGGPPAALLRPSCFSRLSYLLAAPFLLVLHHREFLSSTHGALRWLATASRSTNWKRCRAFDGLMTFVSHEFIGGPTMLAGRWLTAVCWQM